MCHKRGGAINLARAPLARKKPGLRTIPRTREEHLTAFVKAALQFFPLVGAPVSSLIGDYVDGHTQRSINEAVDVFHQRITELGDRVDSEFVLRDEVVEVFKSCYLTIIRTHNHDKLRAAANIVANALLKERDPDKLGYTELDHFTRCIENLSTGAIEVLSVCVRVARKEARVGEVPGSFVLNFDRLCTELASLEPPLLLGLVGELNVYNLLHLRGFQGIRTSDYGNYPIEVTPLALRFADRLLQIK